MQLKTFFRNTTSGAELATPQEGSYASWRQASKAVAEAYRSWAAAPRGERSLAHAAYLEALEREEHARAPTSGWSSDSGAPKRGGFVEPGES